MGQSTATLERLVTEAQVQEYEQNGAICLRGLFGAEWIERLREAVERVKSQKQTAIPGYLSDTFMWRRDADFRAFVFESPAAEIARELMRSKSSRFYFDHLFVKEPGVQSPSPWHHDLPYWPVKGDQVCSVWLALDHVTKASSGLEYVAGSHRWGRRFQPEAFSDAAPAIRGQAEDEKIPDIEANRDSYTLLNWDMEPGDCLVHHALAIHGSGGNTTLDQRRRALATRWVGDDTYYAPESSSYEPLKDASLTSGGSLECEKFPLVIPA
jgi:ectoine hydroxylase-related dioxygenase (phytanoyl-CoA dioxygenase family)